MSAFDRVTEFHPECLRDEVGADRRSGAWPALDQNGLAETLRQALAEGEATRLVVPPGGEGMTIVTGLVGNSWAWATAPAPAAAATSAMRSTARASHEKGIMFSSPH
jgi:hypothetical protein